MIDTVEQKLQDYLRKNYSPKSLAIGNMKSSAEDILVQVAHDWDISHKQARPYDKYVEIAREAIDTFLSNWENKEEGVDNRGQRFGKSYAFT